MWRLAGLLKLGWGTGPRVRAGNHPKLFDCVSAFASRVKFATPSAIHWLYMTLHVMYFMLFKRYATATTSNTVATVATLMYQ